MVMDTCCSVDLLDLPRRPSRKADCDDGDSKANELVMWSMVEVCEMADGPILGDKIGLGIDTRGLASGDVFIIRSVSSDCIIVGGDDLHQGGDESLAFCCGSFSNKSSAERCGRGVFNAESASAGVWILG